MYVGARAGAIHPAWKLVNKVKWPDVLFLQFWNSLWTTTPTPCKCSIQEICFSWNSCDLQPQLSLYNRTHEVPSITFPAQVWFGPKQWDSGKIQRGRWKQSCWWNQEWHHQDTESTVHHMKMRLIVAVYCGYSVGLLCSWAGDFTSVADSGVGGRGVGSPFNMLSFKGFLSPWRFRKV